MKIPKETKPFVWGVVAGAVATMVIGFSWGGWMLGSTAEATAKQRSSSAVIAALAPICVDKFERETDASARLAELKKVSTWEQGAFVLKGGWATLPGLKEPDSSLARACAEMLNNLK